MTNLQAIEQALGKDAKALLDHKCTTISKDRLHLPDPNWVSHNHRSSDRLDPILGDSLLRSRRGFGARNRRRVCNRR